MIAKAEAWQAMLSLEKLVLLSQDVILLELAYVGCVFVP